ncbi:urea carboxylase [Fusarium albosuccineum]|uniref:Urea carboxylase n=1 Tax=Fusarium albosuccineum TaxID=1237068 RepID=A0A8H4LDG0_9HYPO|nr:urea carboxylase [Fusarium albosuccineum]
MTPISRDLLSRHYRLSQCSDSAGTIHHDRRGSATDRPPQSTLQTFPVEPISISPRLPNSSHGRSPSLPYENQPSVFDAITDFATQASQEQLMGKFSIHDPVAESQDYSPGGVSRESGPPTSGDEHMETVETALDFTQLQGFDTDFFSNETDMINEYLMGVFPSMDYRTPIIDNVPDGYGDMDGRPASVPNVPDSSREPSAPMQTAVATAQAQAQASTPESCPFDLDDAADQTNQERDGIDGPLNAIDDIIGSNPWAVSAAAYDKLSAEVMKHKLILRQPFTLPCRQTLSRYIASYIRGFHPHLPFIHLPTACLETMAPVLLLTVAATGSFYGFEHTHGYTMYFFAKSIIAEKLEQRRRASTLHLVRSFPRYAELPNNSSGDHNAQSDLTPQPVAPAFDLELLQALVVLLMTMSWLDGPFAEDALAMSSQLAALTREALRYPPVESARQSWKDWSLEEAKRRTVLSAYFVLNIQTICFNVPPQIPSSEMNVTLPCSEAEFEAPNSAVWGRLHQKSNLHNMGFQYCLKELLSGKSLVKEASASEFGNYMLVQSLLMQIYFERQTTSVVMSSSSSLAPSIIKLYDAALGAWQTCWDSAIESALDPSSVHGPLAFNSTAMLRLAHVHLGAGLFSQCALSSRDPRTKQCSMPSTR